MTVSTTTTSVSYTGNGSTDTFPFAFPLMDDDHLVVTVDGVAQVRGTHYSLTGTRPAAGSVVFEAVYIPALAAAVLLTRSTTLTQETDLGVAETYSEDRVEGMADKLTLALQELKARFDAALVGGAVGSVITFGASAPASGTYALGAIVLNTAPSSGGVIGWVCTVAGTPGTWKPFGLIAD